MLSPDARQVGFAKLTTCLVGAKVDELSIRCTSGRGAALSGGCLKGRGRLLRSRNTLAVPLVNDSALVARDTSLGPGPALSTTLGPSSVLGCREPGQETESKKVLHDARCRVDYGIS